MPRVLGTPVHTPGVLNHRHSFSLKRSNQRSNASLLGKDDTQVLPDYPPLQQLPDTYGKPNQRTARAICEEKYQNATLFLAGQGLKPGFTIPSALQAAFDQASDRATALGNSSSAESFSLPYSAGTGRIGVSGAGVFAEAVQGGSVDDPLTDEVQGDDDLEYYGPMGFGSQNQQLEIDFDTGSADLWIPVNCGNCGNLEQFDADSSSTYENTGEDFGVSYVRPIFRLLYIIATLTTPSPHKQGIGQVSGTVAYDTVSAGSFTVTNQYFGAVSSVSSNFAQAPNSGLAGLAFSTIANDGKPTFFENLMSQGSVEAPLFSVYLTRDEPKGSEICFGCLDYSKAEGDTVQWVPVVSKTYWTVDMNGISVNDQLVSTSGVNGVIDTGTSFIYVPDATAQSIYNSIQGAGPSGSNDGFYYYPCDSQVQISFVFNNIYFALDPQDFNLGTSDSESGTCVGAIIGSSQFTNIAIIGDSFIKSYLTVFDYSHDARVGFVKSINEQ
ncbi:hypothetical protein HYDPIDRAFT_25599 [Hydnomerulius pinastri MD-312]|nr:hypothetical protein HYDPIDRAFT_25599 [Hydnomerulius pinastri MD-312]